MLDPPEFPTWTDQLEARILQSPQSFLSGPHEWVSCVDFNRIKEYALKWVNESNHFTCTYIYEDNFSEMIDLTGPYFDEATSIVETQVVKGTVSKIPS